MLHEKTHNAIFWTTLDRAFDQGIRFVISVILARLVAPEQFGLIAMAMVFTSISQQLMEGGLRSALIQRKDLSSTDCSTVLTANMIFAIVLITLLWFTAPSVAKFYRAEELVLILRVLSVGLLLQAAEVVQSALLSRKLEFRTQTIASVLANIIGGALGIAMAFLGFKVWALVASTLTTSFFKTTLLWILADWRPTSLPSMASFKKLFDYSYKVLALRLIDSGFSNMIPLVLGRIYQPSILGYYQKAFGFGRIVPTNLSAICGKVLFPLLSSKQSNREDYRLVLSTAFKTVSVLAFPLMMCVGVVADPLVNILIGPAWAPVAPILRILCVMLTIQLLYDLNGWALTAAGRAGFAVKVEFVKKTLFVIAIMLTYDRGIQTILIGQCIQAFVGLIVAAVATQAITGYQALHQMKDILPTVVLTIIPAVPLLFVPVEKYSTIVQLMGLAGYYSIASLSLITIFKPDGMTIIKTQILTISKKFN